jgi:hypothetical protein
MFIHINYNVILIICNNEMPDIKKRGQKKGFLNEHHFQLRFRNFFPNKFLLLLLLLLLLSLLGSTKVYVQSLIL